ncbi:MAG: ABC transporter permease subunit [Chromatiales bacterium]|nr:ABC transporter permease subunit [Chromatiales bacterium]
MIKPVILWSDAFFFVLIGLFIAYFYYARTRAHLRAIWRKLLCSKAAMVCAVILVFYFLVAFLDSLHFQEPLEQSAADSEVVYSNEVLSALDKLLWSLRTRSEKSYSAPFATRAYVKEFYTADGMTKQHYPRLQHGGAHLENPDQQKNWDIFKHILHGIIFGAVWAVIIYALLCWFYAKRADKRWLRVMSMLIHDHHELPWRAVMLTMMSLIIVISVVGFLSQYYYVFGTDKIGSDVLYQAIKSIRTGFLIGTLTTLIMLPFALVLGVCAGYFLGKIDDVIQYLYTTLNSIPGVLLVAAAILMLNVYMDQNAEQFTNLSERSDLRLLFLCGILGITSWTGLCRLLRAETLKIKEMNYIEAAQVLGIPHWQVLLRHILPNVMHIVFITIALDFSGLVLAETVLSYINIGVDPTMHSWGNMINSARLEMAREPIVWWPLLAAMIFLFGLVLCANLFADGVRDAFDPRSAESAK